MLPLLFPTVNTYSGIPGLITPEALDHVERIFRGLARRVILERDAEACRLATLPSTPQTEQCLALGELVEQVHALYESHRMVEGNR